VAKATRAVRRLTAPGPEHPAYGEGPTTVEERVTTTTGRLGEAYGGSAAVFDPWSPEFVADPYPAYARLRDESPVVFYEPTGQYLVSTYDDVNALLRDRRLGRTYLHLATHEEMGHPADPPHLDPFWHLVRDGMLDREPPDHTRLRRLVSKAFTPRMVDALKPRVHAIAAELVDQLLDAGSDGSPVDLKTVVAEPLPVTVIAEMLGVPDSDRHLLRPWSADICGMYELKPSPETERIAVRAAVEFSDYLRELSRQRRVRPQDDLISALGQVVDEGDRLTEDELIGTCALLLNAGHEATVGVTSNGWLSLFRNPDQLELLRGRHELLPTAIEELMRYDTPLQMFERWVLEDIEVRGVAIPRGVEVALLFGAANHDPARFPDPERLDLTRTDNPHISFGAGIHYCLGAPLAKVELQASYGEILRRVPRLALAEEPSWGAGYIIRGVESLLVTTR
jgi:cytochrome P450